MLAEVGAVGAAVAGAVVAGATAAAAAGAAADAVVVRDLVADSLVAEATAGVLDAAAAVRFSDTTAAAATLDRRADPRGIGATATSSSTLDRSRRVLSASSPSPSTADLCSLSARGRPPAGHY